MVFAGMSPDGLLPETIEFADHPWFIGVQYHPELKSRPFEPHPAVRELHRRGQGAEPAGVSPVAAFRLDGLWIAPAREGWPSGLRQRS